MSEPCEIRVYVECKPTVVAAREVAFERPVAFSPIAFGSFPERRWDLRWACRLSDANHVAVGQARRFGHAAGIPVRVIDLGRGNVLVRVLRRAWFGRRGLPTVVLRGACPWALLGTPSQDPRSLPEVVPLIQDGRRSGA